MSSNNALLVKENEPNQYSVHDYDVDTGFYNKTIGHFTNLRKAILAAEHYSKNTEFGVEHGIQFQLKGHPVIKLK